MSANLSPPTSHASDETLSPVAPNLFAPIEGESGKYGLIGGYCRDCKQFHYPLPDYCPTCLRPPERTVVGRSGRIYSYTVVRTKAPFKLPEPYAVGYIDLDESGLRVFGLFDLSATEALESGMAVELTVARVGVDGRGQKCLRPVFRPMGLPDVRRPA